MWLHYIALAMVVCLLPVTTPVFAGTIPSGYEKLGWNADFAQVVRRYPRGQSVRLAGEVFYKQQHPNKMISRRNFAFSEDKLHAVAVTFDKRYVEKSGIENILGAQKKRFGEGNMDRSQAPHMIKCIWEGSATRITFVFAPKRPDMTVIMYERK